MPAATSVSPSRSLIIGLISPAAVILVSSS